MKKKPYKIKRYRRSFGGSARRGRRAVKILLCILALAALFALGWLFAKPALDFASGTWYKLKNSFGGGPSSSAAVSSQSASSSQAQSEVPAEQTPQPQDGLWREVPAGTFASEEKAAAAIAQLKEAGATHLVITLKDSTGYLNYKSAVPGSETAVSASAVDAALAVRLIRQAGLVPVAQLWCYEDSIAPKADLDKAVRYQQQEYLWLNSSRELGGKPWLNPYSPKAESYLTSIVTEVAGLGFEDVVLQGVQFPYGYSLELAGYGETGGVSHPDQLRAVTQRLTAAAQAAGARGWVAYPEAALNGTDLTGYDENPLKLGAPRIVVLAGDLQLPLFAGDGGESLAARLEPYVQEAKKQGTESFVLKTDLSALPTDAVGTLRAGAKKAGFSHVAG